MKKKLSFLWIILLLFTGCSEEEAVMQHDPDHIVIALLDTGVSTDAIESDHLLAGYNYLDDTTDTEDQLSHGTAVASTILGCESAEVSGLAEDAYLVPLVIVTRQEGDIVSVSPETLAKAIQDSIDLYGADIINVSLGIQKDHERLREAVEYASQKGVPVISAAGNDGGDGKPYYPAAYDTVLSVGSCDRNREKSDFSQSGADVLAPGEDLLLASKNGLPYGAKGTSFATGFVSAYAANFLMEEPDLTPEELYSKIIEKANSYGGYLPQQ